MPCGDPGISPDQTNLYLRWSRAMIMQFRFRYFSTCTETSRCGVIDVVPVVLPAIAGRFVTGIDVFHVVKPVSHRWEEQYSFCELV